jgi:hypothetical protein
MSSVQLYTGCPCGSGSYYWRHYRDGGSIYLKDTGYIFCTKCGTNTFIKYVSFDCNKHCGGQFVSYKTMGDFTYALSVAVKSLEAKGVSGSEMLSFYARLLNNLSNSTWK